MTVEKRTVENAMSLSPASKPQEIDVQALMRGLVHELRNPLSAVLTASSLVQGGPDVDEETAMLLEVIQKESRRMNAILTEFSHFVKPPSPNIEPFDFSDLTHRVVSRLQSEGEFREVEIQSELNRPTHVAGDEVQTEGALRHVLHNAAQVLENGGCLRLCLEEIDGVACIVIEDSGGEVAPEVIERAFQPFFSTKPAGTGLGLSIARSVLRAAKGDVIFEAGQQGARVKLCLPVHQA